MELKVSEEWIRSVFEQVLEEYEFESGVTLKEAAEKQIPKKPINYSIYNRGYMIYECECPSCQHSRREAYLFAYCEKCGQRIDWSV